MLDAFGVRTTLNLDDDVLETAKVMAASQHKPLGEVVSGLMRRAVEALLLPRKSGTGYLCSPFQRVRVRSLRSW
jgi:hypothetical protein